MLIIPAIDLRDGNVVRLHQGDYTKEKIYSDDPAYFAEKWKDEGASLLHIVDLDGAKEGTPMNLASLEAIIKRTAIDVEFGGGLRSLEDVKKVVDIGVKYAVIGTKALDEVFLKSLVNTFSDHIVVGIDARDGIVQTNGWLKGSGEMVHAVCSKIEKIGIKRIIFTDIKRDGTLVGPNIDSLIAILNKTKLEVIASGGISSLEDIEKLSVLGYTRLVGAITGKALYENRFSLSEAVSITKK